MALSRTAIDNRMWDVRMYMAHRIGMDESARMVYPLGWYVSTGRASSAFLEKLLAADVAKIADALMKGGSDEDAVNRMCRAIGHKRIA